LYRQSCINAFTYDKNGTHFTTSDYLKQALLSLYSEVVYLFLIKFVWLYFSYKTEVDNVTRIAFREVNNSGLSYGSDLPAFIHLPGVVDACTMELFSRQHNHNSSFIPNTYGI
jgi:hypothetical protein